MAWTLVQQAAAQGTGVTTISLPGASTVGNLLIATASSGSSTAIVPPAGWSVAISIANASNESYICPYYNNPGGITAFAPTGGAGTFQLDIAEFTCPGVTSVAAASATGTQTGAAVTTITVTTGGTAQAGDLAIVMGLQHLGAAAAITWTNPSGYTPLALSVTSLVNHQYAARNLAVASGGAQSVAITSSLAAASSSGWTGAVATFSQPATALLPQQVRRRAPALFTRIAAPGHGAVYTR